MSGSASSAGSSFVYVEPSSPSTSSDLSFVQVEHEDGDPEETARRTRQMARDLHVPLLIVGPPGSGKTFELSVYAVGHAWYDTMAGAPSRRILCLAAHNTAVLALQTKMRVAYQFTVDEAERRQRFQQTPPPSQPAEYLEPQYDTFHHTCRRWLIKYGHLIGQPSVRQVCTEERAKLILHALQDGPEVDLFDEPPDLHGEEIELDWEEVARGARQALQDDLTIVVPNDSFLRAAVRCAHLCRRLNMTPVLLQRFFSTYKLNNYEITEELEYHYDGRQIDEARSMREYYDGLLRHNQLYDMDDLVVLGLHLVQQHTARIIAEEKIGLVCVDDLHNTSPVQRQLVATLIGDDGTRGRLIATCEDIRLASTSRPAIRDEDDGALHAGVYAFSGANERIDGHDLMTACLKEGQNFATVILALNQRSSFTVQRIAYAILNRELVNLHPSGPQCRAWLCGFDTIKAEARFIHTEAESIQLDDALGKRPMSSIAVLTRTNEHIRFLVDELVARRAPVRVMGVESNDLSSDEAIDLLSFLAAAYDPSLHHLVDRAVGVYRECMGVPALTLRQLPAAEVMHVYVAEAERAYALAISAGVVERFMKFLRRINTLLRKGRSIGAILDSLLELLGYKETYLRISPFHRRPALAPVDQRAVDESYFGARWENVQSFLRRARDFDDRFESMRKGDRVDMFLRECHAYAATKLAYLPRQPRQEITLCTMHYALGSEFDAVFISGMEHGSMPREHSSRQDLDADRKLLFLACLRAKRQLYFLHLTGRDGAEEQQRESTVSSIDGDAMQAYQRRPPPPPPHRSPPRSQQAYPQHQQITTFLNPALPLLHTKPPSSS